MGHAVAEQTPHSIVSKAKSERYSLVWRNQHGGQTIRFVPTRSGRHGLVEKFQKEAGPTVSTTDITLPESLLQLASKSFPGGHAGIGVVDLSPQYGAIEIRNGNTDVRHEIVIDFEKGLYGVAAIGNDSVSEFPDFDLTLPVSDEMYSGFAQLVESATKIRTS